MVFFNEVSWQNIYFQIPHPFGTIILPIESTNIQINDGEEIKGIKRSLFQWEASITIAGIAALDLYSNLRMFTLLRLVARIRVNAN